MPQFEAGVKVDWLVCYSSMNIGRIIEDHRGSSWLRGFALTLRKLRSDSTNRKILDKIATCMKISNHELVAVLDQYYWYFLFKADNFNWGQWETGVHLIKVIRRWQFVCLCHRVSVSISLCPFFSANFSPSTSQTPILPSPLISQFAKPSVRLLNPSCLAPSLLNDSPLSFTFHSFCA